MLTYLSVKRFTLGHRQPRWVGVRARFWNGPVRGACSLLKELSSVELLFKTYWHGTGRGGRAGDKRPLPAALV